MFVSSKIHTIRKLIQNSDYYSFWNNENNNYIQKFHFLVLMLLLFWIDKLLEKLETRRVSMGTELCDWLMKGSHDDVIHVKEKLK